MIDLIKKWGDDFTSPSEMELNVERHVEDPHRVDSHQNEPQRDAQLGPFLAGYAQLSGRDDIVDVAGDEHAAGDEQSHEHRLNLHHAHSRADLGCSQGGIVQGGDHVHPV